MKTIRINIDDSIFEKFMGLLDILPKNKISIEKTNEQKEFIVSSVDEVKLKISTAENRANYTSSDDFWSNIDKKLEKF